MLFATTPHILIFVTLILVHYGVDGVQITGLSPRKHGGPDRPSPAPGPAPNPAPSTTSSTVPINSSPNQSSPLPSHISSTSATHAGSTSLSSSASSLAASASSNSSSAEARKIGTIVGAVLGSVFLSSLGLMTIAHFYRRARKARKQPRGSSYFNEPDTEIAETEITQTEMSQTQNGLPLTSSAPLVHRPEPLHFFNSSSMNYTSSMSPLIPAVTFLDATSSSRRPLSFSEFDANFDEPSDPLQSPFDTPPSFSSLDGPRPERAVSARPASSSISGQPSQASPFDLSLDIPLLQKGVSSGPPLSSTFGQLSPLHQDMVGFQKTLEADHKRDTSDQSQSSTISTVGDPPPKYIG